jgi:hypothetical protein
MTATLVNGMRNGFAAGAALLLMVAAARAQPAAVEVFGQVGLARAAGDEGSLGTGPSFGGALMAPIRPWLAFDVDIQVTRARRRFSSNVEFRANQVLISPSLVYRRGNRRVYFFAGGGIGAEFVTKNNRRFSGENRGAMLLAKTGLVAALGRRLVLRTDLLVGFRYVLPHLGLRAGVGYRF